jgi:hypothetical protein
LQSNHLFPLFSSDELRKEIPRNVLDNEVLVPNVVDAITIFLVRLLDLLQVNDEDETILQIFLSRTNNKKEIVILAHPEKDGAVTFTRITVEGSMKLYLPRVRGGYAPNSSFGHDILEALMGISNFDPIKSIPPVALETEPEFVDVGGMRTWAHKVVFPEVSQIPRPEVLMQQTPLYLRLVVGDNNNFELEGNQRSVNLVHDYLKLHGQSPSGQVMLVRKKISWGSGLSSIFVQDNRSGFICSPLVAVSLIEGILGFYRISIDPSCKTWLFQRDKPFST